MFKKTAFFAAALVGPAALAGLAATSSPAAAQEAIPSATVYYTDLDLSSPDDQKILERRLVKAARKICKMDQPAVGSNLPSASSLACYHQATDKFDGQIAAATRDQNTSIRLGG